MTKCFTAVFLIISTLAVAQTRYRTVSGRLTDKDNLPLAGVNVTILGTATGTVTDVQGNYSLDAPIGSTVVFSFIGMKTRYALVTEVDLIPISETDGNTKGNKIMIATRKPVRQIPTLPFKPVSDSVQAGVAILHDYTPTYKHRGATIKQDNIRSIKPALGSGSSHAKTFRVRMSPYVGYSLQFTTAIGIETITQTPALQQGYAQGRAAQWRGPEYQEIFSWGPALNTLQYDGSSYPYSRSGRLVPVGTGNGATAKARDASPFFRTGFNTAYNLSGSLQRSGWGTVALEASHKNQHGVIPNAGSTQDHIMLQVKKIPLHARWTSDVYASYDRSAGRLVNRGANYASIVGSVWRTPVSFDNANGLSPRRAVAAIASSRLADGTVRAHAPGLADNPYGLVRELPDEDLTNRFVTGLAVKYTGTRGFRINTSANVEKQWNDVVSGVPPGLSAAWDGRIMHRHQALTGFDLAVAPVYTKQINDHQLEVGATLDHHYQEQNLRRHDGLGFLPSEWGNPDHGTRATFLQRSLIRSIQEISLYGEYTSPEQIAIVKLSNRGYFSNTLRSSRYTNFFPNVQGRIFLNHLLMFYDVYELSVGGSFARTLREGPLLYSNWSYLPTRGRAAQYNTFYEASELFFNRLLSPEIERNAQGSIRFDLRRKFFADFTLHNSITSDFIAPRWTGSSFEFTNVGRIKNYGTSASIKWSHTTYPGTVKYKIGLHWARQNSLVEVLYGADAFVPVAGFSTVAKVLGEDKPLGAIYGSRYQRDASGQVMIGEDGFPLVDHTMAMIGNPIPDWTGSLDLSVEWKGFALECVFDIRKGGDVWNGTHAALNYLGRSATTGQERNTSGYVFPGINSYGEPNITPVSFYDPATPLEQNRWVRDGFEGVGEAYIEDASWIRFQELVASYKIRPKGSSKIHEVRFSFIANNLFLITGYSGVDPASSLFGYAGSSGLDLFNTPGIRSFTAKMTFKL